MRTSRRQFISLLGGAAATWPITARGQLAETLPLIGLLFSGSEPALARYLRAFRDGMYELGYRNKMRLEYRFAEGYLDRLPTLAAELVKLNRKCDCRCAPAINSGGTPSHRYDSDCDGIKRRSRWFWSCEEPCSPGRQRHWTCQLCRTVGVETVGFSTGSDPKPFPTSCARQCQQSASRFAAACN